METYKSLSLSAYHYEDGSPMFNCPICTRIITDPVDHNCGATFCRKCLLAQTTCPSCKSSSIVSSVKATSIYLKDQLDKISVTCANCKERLLYALFDAHDRDECEHNCPYDCGSTVTRNAYSLHTLECDKIMRKCPATMCNYYANGQEHKDHVQTCIYAAVDPVIESFVRQSRAEHNEIITNLAVIDSICENTVSIQSKMDELERKLSGTTSHLSSLTANRNGLDDLNRWKTELSEKLQMMARDFSDRLGALKMDLLSEEKQCAKTANDAFIGALQVELQTLQDVLLSENTAERINTLSANIMELLAFLNTHFVSKMGHPPQVDVVPSKTPPPPPPSEARTDLIDKLSYAIPEVLEQLNALHNGYDALVTHVEGLEGPGLQGSANLSQSNMLAEIHAMDLKLDTILVKLSDPPSEEKVHSDRPSETCDLIADMGVQECLLCGERAKFLIYNAGSINSVGTVGTYCGCRQIGSNYRIYDLLGNFVPTKEL